MDIRHKIPIQLTHHPEKNIRLAWSPNGKWITFVSNCEKTQDIQNGRWRFQLNKIDQPKDSSQREEIHAIYTMNLTGALQLWPVCTWSLVRGHQMNKWLPMLQDILQEKAWIFHNWWGINQLTNIGRGIRTRNLTWSPGGNWIACSVRGCWVVRFGDSTIYLVETIGEIPKLLKETADLSSAHVPVWISVDYFSVYPDENKQIVTWEKLKQYQVMYRLDNFWIIL